MRPFYIYLLRDEILPPLPRYTVWCPSLTKAKTEGKGDGEGEGKGGNKNVGWGRERLKEKAITRTESQRANVVEPKYSYKRVVLRSFSCSTNRLCVFRLVPIICPW